MNESSGAGTSATRSPWVWVGCGCAVILLVIALVVAGTAFFGVMTFRGMKDGLQDPVAREAKALEILGAEELPGGYHPLLSLEVPFLMSLTLLGDNPAPEGLPDEEDLRVDRLLAFVRMRDFGGAQRREIGRFFEGESSDLDLDIDLDLELGERIGEGSLDLASGDRLRWGVRHCDYRSRDGERRDGTCTMALGECRSRSWIDFALWIRPLEDAREASRIEADLRTFLEPVEVCRDR